jgi:acetylornithine/N-succinyldiaminopimelate aminotransferase
MAEGSGSWLVDDRGRRYLDFVQGWAVNCLGHSPPAVVAAVSRQAGRLVNCSPAFHSDLMADFTAELSARSGLAEVFLCNSGAEANEGAIKLARKWGAVRRGGAFEIVTMEHAFHGRTLATMSASGKPGWDALFEPKVPGFRRVPLNDLAAADAAITDRTAAVMVEPIQGEAGVFVAADDYLAGLREITRRRGALLVFDEIQTGMGRTGKLFGFEHSGIRPDVMTLGKGLGGGVAVAALLATREASCFEYGEQGGTFNGNLIALAAAGAVLTTLTRPGFLADAAARGDYMMTRLRKLSADLGHGEVRGRGMLAALRLVDADAQAVVDRARDEHGLLVNAPRPDSVRLMPALTVSAEEIDEMIVRLRASLG